VGKGREGSDQQLARAQSTGTDPLGKFPTRDAPKGNFPADPNRWGGLFFNHAGAKRGKTIPTRATWSNANTIKPGWMRCALFFIAATPCNSAYAVRPRFPFVLFSFRFFRISTGCFCKYEAVPSYKGFARVARCILGTFCANLRRSDLSFGFSNSKSASGWTFFCL